MVRATTHTGTPAIENAPSIHYHRVQIDLPIDSNDIHIHRPNVNEAANYEFELYTLTDTIDKVLDGEMIAKDGTTRWRNVKPYDNIVKFTLGPLGGAGVDRSFVTSRFC